MYKKEISNKIMGCFIFPKKTIFYFIFVRLCIKRVEISCVMSTHLINGLC